MSQDLGAKRVARLAPAAGLFLLAANIFAQTAPERFWLAGRYDGNHVIVYFDSVKLGETIPKNLGDLIRPVADGIFAANELPAPYAKSVLSKNHLHTFDVGDRYDLMVGGDWVTHITLTKFLAAVGDELAWIPKLESKVMDWSGAIGIRWR